MKKRISLVLLALVMVLSFAGCSGKKASISSEDREMLVTYSKAIVEGLAQCSEEDYEFYRDLSEFELNIVLISNLGIPTTTEDFLAMLNSWEAAEDECGEYVIPETYEFTLKENSDGYVLSALVSFEERDATVSVSFDEKYNITSVDVSAKYALGEIMQKAGLNTVLGMGVVFAVLIFLAFIIGLMKYIPMLLGNEGTKEAKPVQDKPSTGAEADMVTTATVSECMNDLELIAVISAAIAAQEGTTTDGFIVRSIRRRPSNRWK